MLYACNNIIAIHFIFDVCQQLINDVEDDLSAVCSFGNAGVKKESSLGCFRYTNNEGNSALYLVLALCCVHVGFFRHHNNTIK